MNNGNRAFPKAARALTAQGVRKAFLHSCSFLAAQTESGPAPGSGAASSALNSALLRSWGLSPRVGLGEYSPFRGAQKGNLLALFPCIYDKTLKELCIYVFISHLSSIIHRLKCAFVDRSGGKLYIFKGRKSDVGHCQYSPNSDVRGARVTWDSDSVNVTPARTCPLQRKMWGCVCRQARAGSVNVSRSSTPGKRVGVTVPPWKENLALHLPVVNH